MKLSEHLTLKEAITSQTAIRNGIDNSPTDEHLENMKYFALTFFEPLRTYISTKRGVDSPIHVSSFYRSEALNTKIKGSSSSQHCKGEAADLECNYDDFNNKDLFFTILNRASFDQLIAEFRQGDSPAWIHVSTKKFGNRKQALIAAKDPETDKTIYLPYSPDNWAKYYK